MTSFYTDEELKEIGFKKIGEKVLLSKKTSIYSPEKISIGDNVRIDDFCILSGNIHIGSNIHIACFCLLFGDKEIYLNDFSGLSSRVAIYSAIDDFSGNYLVGPIHEKTKRNVLGGPVRIEKHAIVGTNATIFPNVIISTGAIIGAHSFVNKSVCEWTVNAGIPCKRIKDRNRNLLNLID